MKIRILTLTASLTVVLAGCVCVPPISEQKSRHGITFRGPITQEQAELIDKALDVFPPHVLKAIECIAINDDQFHFLEDQKTPELNNQAAHYHPSVSCICIRSNKIYAPNIWHEVGHAYHYYLNSSTFFRGEWKKIAGDIYPVYGIDNNFPKNGVLTKYGGTNYDEDISEYVENFYITLQCPTVISQFKKFTQKERQDHRYKAKLELLHKYGFFKEEDYQLFMSRNYVK